MNRPFGGALAVGERPDDRVHPRLARVRRGRGGLRLLLRPLSAGEAVLESVRVDQARGQTLRHHDRVT